MPSVEASEIRPIGATAMGAFIGFFLGPAIIVPTLILSPNETISYGNTGLVLIFSVIAGAACGAAIGAATRLRQKRRGSTTRIAAELAGAITGGLLGGVAMTENPGIGAVAGVLFGAISGGLLSSGPSNRDSVDTLNDDDRPLWDRDLDA